MGYLFFLFIVICSFASYHIYQNIQDGKLLSTVTQNGRGTWSERDLIIRLLKAGFPSENIFHDLYIQKKDETYSQVDLVVLTEVGVIVIEVKKYSGWIYGTGNREKWVQVLDYGNVKYPIYNPIFQNDGHIRAIKKQIPNYFDLPFHSLIVFYGDCELKKISQIPAEVIVVKANNAIAIINDLLQNIPTKNFYKEELVSVLKKGVENGDDLDIQNKHILNIKDKFSLD
jgi:hypothetical protein